VSTIVARRRVVDVITARAQMRQQHVDPLLRINDADTQMRSARPPAQDGSRGDRAGACGGMTCASAGACLPVFSAEQFPEMLRERVRHAVALA
jgi:hypothetical protein